MSKFDDGMAAAFELVASWMERGDDLDATELRRYAEDARAQAERARS